jgi:hypothetical protein
MSAPNPRAYTTPPSATHALTPTRLLLTPYQDQPTVRSAELCSRQPEKSAANDRSNRRWELAVGDGHAALGAWRRRVTTLWCGVRSNSAPAVRVLRPCWVLPCCRAAAVAVGGRGSGAAVVRRRRRGARPRERVQGRMRRPDAEEQGARRAPRRRRSAGVMAGAAYGGLLHKTHRSSPRGYRI